MDFAKSSQHLWMVDTKKVIKREKKATRFVAVDREESEECRRCKKVPKQKQPKTVLPLNYIDVTRGYRVISKIFLVYFLPSSLFAYCLWEITNLI
jgi:hypothetical protein